MFRQSLVVLLLIALGVLWVLSSQLPPEPPHPQNFVGQAYNTGEHIPVGYAPPWNVFDNQLFFTLIAHETGDTVTLEIAADHEGMLFYKTFYVYDKSAPGQWRAYNFSDDENWVPDAASAQVSLDKNSLDAESWVIIYGCTRRGGAWKCGCYSKDDPECKKWSIQNFSVNKVASGCAASFDGPRNGACTALTNDSFTATWTPSTLHSLNASTDRQLLRVSTSLLDVKRGCPAGSHCVVKEDHLSWSTTTYHVTGLDAGTTYYVRVANLCNDTNGTSWTDEVWNCTTEAPTGCPDNDGDGYADESCGGTDCDDDNANIHPGAAENCTNRVDDDCDESADCADADCPCAYCTNDTYCLRADNQLGEARCINGQFTDCQALKPVTCAENYFNCDADETNGCEASAPCGPSLQQTLLLHMNQLTTYQHPTIKGAFLAPDGVYFIVFETNEAGSPLNATLFKVSYEGQELWRREYDRSQVWVYSFTFHDGRLEVSIRDLQKGSGLEELDEEGNVLGRIYSSSPRGLYLHHRLGLTNLFVGEHWNGTNFESVLIRIDSFGNILDYQRLPVVPHSSTNRVLLFNTTSVLVASSNITHSAKISLFNFDQEQERELYSFTASSDEGTDVHFFTFKEGKAWVVLDNVRINHWGDGHDSFSLLNHTIISFTPTQEVSRRTLPPLNGYARFSVNNNALKAVNIRNYLTHSLIRWTDLDTILLHYPAFASNRSDYLFDFDGSRVLLGHVVVTDGSRLQELAVYERTGPPQAFCSGDQTCITDDFLVGQKHCNRGVPGPCEPQQPLLCALHHYDCDENATNGCESTTPCS